MAFSATQAAAEFVSRGMTGVADIYTGLRQYNLSDHIRFYDRTLMPFDWILRMKMTNFSVSDPEPKTLIRRERPIEFTPAAASDANGDFAEGKVWLSAADVKFVQAGDVLMCPDIGFKVVSSTNTWSTTKGTYPPETMIVLQVIEGAHASGYGAVLVHRGCGKATTANSPTEITTSMKLIKLSNSLADGGTASTVIDHQLGDVQNYCQLMDITWGETITNAATKYYGKLTMEQKAELSRQYLMRNIEFNALFGRKAYSSDANGKRIWLSGGILEDIPGATDAEDGVSRLFNHGGPFRLDDMRRKMEIAFRYGNPRKEKLMLIGAKLYTEILNTLEASIEISLSEAKSMEWGLDVKSVNWGSGRTFMVIEPAFTSISTTSNDYGYDYFIIDLDYVDEMHVDGLDLQIKENVQNANVLGVTHQLFGQIGLHRSNPSAHAYGFGITN